MIKWIFVLVLTGASVVCCIAQPVILSDLKRYELKPNLLYYKDSTGTLLLDDVKGKPFKQASTINLGFDKSVHWFSFDLINESDQHEWWLEIAFSPLDKIEFHYPDGTNETKKISGDAFPVSQRDVHHPHPVFRFFPDPGKKIRCYLRIETTSSVQVPAILWHPEEFNNSNFDKQIFNGLFYGALIILILYQLFLFVSTREKVSLYYVFTLVAMMHVVAYFQGYSFLYLYPEHPYLNHYMAVITGPFFLFFSTWLTRSFLNLPENNPLLDKLLLINLGFDVLSAILMIFLPDIFSYQIHHFAILLHSLLALTAASISIYRKYRPALFYLLSWITLLICALVFSLSNLGLFKSYLITDSAWLIVGCVLQMLLISFALGNRWIILNRENQLSKELALKAGQEEKEKLEREVRIRTEKIQLQNRELEEVNLIKDKLFSVVSHDIKGPLTSLQLALGLIKSETISEAEFRDLAQILEVRFNQTTEFIENMLQWAKLQLNGMNYEPVSVNVREIAESTLKLLDYEIQSKQIEKVNKVDGSFYVMADLNMMRSIMRNLVTNAVKFTSAGGTVTVDSQLNGAYVKICVTDTGVGIPEGNKPKLFSLGGVTTPGTKQEKGTGLGLLLCKEFVERNNGKIWFESEVGKGTTFYIDLPIDSGKSNL